MAVKLINQAQFLHIPKTGGTWIKSVLKSKNLILSSDNHRHADYDYNLFFDHGRKFSGRKHLQALFKILLQRFQFKNSVKEESTPFRFCFVRNPLSWYESWWKYMEARGWNHYGKENSANNWHPVSMLNGLGSSDFNEFIWNAIKKRPGYVSELFFSYTKSGISYIGKTENLRQDFSDILTLMKLEVDDSSLFDSPKVNMSKTPESAIEWDPKLKQTLTRLELPALIHFGYLNEQEQEKYGIKNFIPPNKALQRKR